MKHTVKITLILITLFFVAQIVGLFTVNNYLEVEKKPDGTVNIVHVDTVVGPPPEIPQDQKSYNFIAIVIAILISTAILLILIKFKMHRAWKFWFFIAIAVTLSISFDVYVTRWIAVALAVILAGIRVFKPNVIIHNFTEIFIYTGITIILLPWLNLYSGFVLLLLISLYDMFAVWKSKHMIELAQFQLDSKMFAGLAMNYTHKKDQKVKQVKAERGKRSSNAILGGGDIAFPLLFAAVVMEHLILIQEFPKMLALYYSFLIPLGAGIGLTALLFLSEKEKFYPAMPFISLGCVLGYGLILIL